MYHAALPMLRRFLLRYRLVFVLLLFWGSAISAPPLWSAPSGASLNQSVPPFNEQLYFPSVFEAPSIRQVTNDTAVDSQPVWSPDGRRISFISDRDGNQEVFIMDANGGHLRQLTNDLMAAPTEGEAWLYGSPSWSPDGRTIAVVLSRCWTCNLGGHEYFDFEMFLINVNNGFATAVASDAADPIWSPDGSKILYYIPGDYTVQYRHYGMMNGDGSNPHEVLELDDEQPEWSPDSSKLLFASDIVNSTEVSSREIYIMGSDGSGLTDLTKSAAQEYAPQWSPDGNKIAFYRIKKLNSPGDIFVMDADGSHVTNLTESAAHDYLPQWSPDGSKIAFASIKDFNSNGDIFVIDADGSHMTNLTKSATHEHSPLWLAAGNKIAFVRYESSVECCVKSIDMVDADGSHEQQVISDLTSTFTEAVWSPTGSRIAYVHKDDIYVMSFE